jgi:hypothetical protein
MHLWDQHSTPAGHFPAQNPAAEAHQQWQLPAHQPVLSPAYRPDYQPPSTSAPAQNSLQDNSHAATEAAGQHQQQQQQWLGDGPLVGQAGPFPFDGCQAGLPAGQSGFSPRPDPAPQQVLGSQQQQGIVGQAGSSSSSSFGLMGPPASRAIPCPPAKLPAASSPSAAAAAAAAAEGLGGQSLSMDTSMLDLPEPDAMSWRPGVWGWGGRGGWRRRGGIGEQSRLEQFKNSTEANGSGAGCEGQTCTAHALHHQWYVPAVW